MSCRFVLTLILTMVLGCTSPSIGAEGRSDSSSDESKWIISSGITPPLPAGSLLGLALALERGASSLWLDLVLSADDKLVLLSDVRIERSTNVKTIFPDRSRPDGSYYSFDFTLDELQQLSLTPHAVLEYLPLGLSRSHLPVTALDDFLHFVDLMSDDLETPPALICILKQGWRHQQEGKDLGAAVLDALNNYQSRAGTAALMVGSYDPEELQQLALSRGAGPVDSIEFMQLIGADDGKEVQRLEFGTYQPYSYDLLFTKFGLKAVSDYADTIGLDPEAVFDGSGELLQPRFLDDAHALGLRVVCSRIDSLPEQLLNLESRPEALLEHLLFTIGFDGIVTTEDRRARGWLVDLAEEGGNEQNRIIERLIDQIGERDAMPSDPVQSDTTR
ncbi:MAG: hypothetical protein KJO28_03050 [Desulfofustis sp.]|nr:hypothetical protein [Desulfofustis sp.]